MYIFEVVDRETKKPIVNDRTVIYRATIDILLERWTTLDAVGRREFIKQVHESDKAGINGKRGIVKVSYTPDSDTTKFPELYDHDYIDKVFVGEDIHLLIYRGGTVRVRHICKRKRDQATVIVAPQLQLDNGGHRIVQKDPYTISPSIECGDCGLHGFIREGKWESV